MLIHRTSYCGDFRHADSGSDAGVTGWVQTRRDHGGCILVDLRDLDIDVTQIDIGNAATEMTSGFTAEPTIDVRHVADTIAHIVGLPVDVSVPTVTVMARGMRYVGRG